MSQIDLQPILLLLRTIQIDINDLKKGQEGIKVEQEGIKEGLRDLKLGQDLIKLEQEGMKEELRTVKEDLRTMKAAAAHHVDSLSKQMIGVVRDFDSFGEKMQQMFRQWSENADSRVTDKVMAIQGPRIRAMEDRFHEIKKAG
jgi:hypothetical protein